MDTVSIRSALSNDLDEMCRISLQAHQQAYAELIPATHRTKFDRHYTDSPRRRERYRSKMQPRLDDDKWLVLVACIDNKVVGYTLGEYTAEDHLMKHGLFVDPAFTKRGIGSALFNASIASLKPGDQIELEVVENNEIAKRLYEKFGFQIVGYSQTTFFGAKLLTMTRMID